MDTPQGPAPDPVPPCVEGAEELEERLNALAPKHRAAFREWLRSKNLFFPPETPEILERMAVEVSAIEDRAADERAAYGEGSPND